MEQLNIVELIEKNPITKLSSVYNNKLLNKIKNNFTCFFIAAETNLALVFLYINLDCSFIFGWNNLLFIIKLL